MRQNNKNWQSKQVNQKFDLGNNAPTIPANESNEFISDRVRAILGRGNGELQYSAIGINAPIAQSKYKTETGIAKHIPKYNKDKEATNFLGFASMLYFTAGTFLIGCGLVQNAIDNNEDVSNQKFVEIPINI